jgi:hypothetical protein
MNHTEVIERATIINRDTFRLDTDNPEIGDSGTVEVSVSGSHHDARTHLQGQ